MKPFSSVQNGLRKFPGSGMNYGFLRGCFSFRVVMSTGLGASFCFRQLDHHVGQMVVMMADMMADMKFEKTPGNQGFLRL